MRSKLLIGGLAAAVAFLLATSPLVAQAAGFITSADIVNNTIKSKDIKKGQVKSSDVKNDGLKGKDIREDTLTGVNADRLDGLDGSAYAKAAQPAFTPVTLGAGYSQFPGYSTPGFLMDTLGFVHLKGTMNCPAGGTAFTLPVGARPAQNHFFPMAVGSSGAGNVQVLTDGQVVTFHADGAAHACSVDGVTFRTDTTSPRPAGAATEKSPNN